MKTLIIFVKRVITLHFFSYNALKLANHHRVHKASRRVALPRRVALRRFPTDFRVSKTASDVHLEDKFLPYFLVLNYLLLEITLTFWYFTFLITSLNEMTANNNFII